MKIYGGVAFDDTGLTTSIRAMHLQASIVDILNENVIGFDKVGYQRKDPVVSSFTEFLGVHGLSTAVNDQIGRIGQTDNPLDLVPAKKGYFQYQTDRGIQLTRDGRFKLDKYGNLLTLASDKVLGTDGMPIQLPFVPESLSDIKVNSDGDISVYNPKNHKMVKAGTVSIVTHEGIAVLHPNIKQGYNEYSNVSLSEEFLSLVPVRRNFDANRQMFVMQNNNLSKAIQQLGGQ